MMSSRQPQRKSSSKKQTSKKQPASKNAKQKSAPHPRKFPAVKVIGPAQYRNREKPPSKETPITDLPFSYNQTKLCLLVRDPYWAYTYWDFSGETWNWIQNLKVQQSNMQPILRIHNMDTNGHQDIKVELNAKNWYIHLGTPNARFEAELGLLESYGHFHRIAKSNAIRTPRNALSNRVDPEWDSKDFDEIYRLSGGGNIGHGSEIHAPK